MGIIQLAGLALIVYFVTKSMGEHHKTVQMLAMFKKARDPGDMQAMVDITEQLGDAPEKVEIVPEEEHFYPHELGVDALAAIRKQM